MTVKVNVNVKPILDKYKVSLDEILDEAGDYLVKGAVRRSPVLTGRLKASIGNKASGDGIWDRRPEGLAVGSNVEYAAVQEFDTSFHHKTGQAHYMQDAAIETAQKLQDIAVGKLRWMK